MVPMSEVEDPRVGRVLENRYTITRRIADGGMASVYLAQDSRLERTVAIKIIHSQLAQGPHRDQFLHRFHAEAKSAAALSNPHIVQVYDTGEFDGLQYIVMEYVHGVNLRESMERNPTFSVRDTLRILSETLDGLATAHQAGLVHRDIKPENILINSRGHVQITDFGLAKAVSDATMGTTGLLLGTAAYLAPEMIESNKATPQGDLYSVGVMGYEMLTGSVPFTSDNPITMVFKHVHDDVPSLADHGGDFPTPLVNFISRLDARDPQNRPSDASQALKELQETAALIPREALFYKFTPLNAEQPSAVSDTSDVTTSLTPPPNTQENPTEEFLHSTGTPVVEHTSVMERNPEAPEKTAQPPHPPITGKTGKAKKTNTKNGKKRRGLIIGLAAAVAAVVVGGLIWWWFWGPGSYWTVPEASDKPCTEQSCTLKGASYSRYKQTLTALGIDYTTTEKYSDTIADGKIVSANPDVEGHVTRRGGQLKLVVSKGIQKLTVPTDLLDCDATSDAEDTLNALGFTNLTLKKEYSLDKDKGCAISSSVQPGTTLAHNAEITLTVSQGPKPVEIPQLAGKSEDDATKALEALQLKVTVKKDFSDSIASGSVISSEPSENATAHWGDEVTLTVSKGPETVEMPSLVGTSKDEAVKKLEGLGLKVKISLPLQSETLHVVLRQSPDAGEKVRLRDSSGKATTVTLTIV